MLDIPQKELNLKLLRGKPFTLDKIGTLYPLSLDEISDIGETKYYQYLSIATFDAKEVQNIKDNSEKIELSTFELILTNFLYGENNADFKENFIKSLSLFFREEVTFVKEYAIFVLGLESSNPRVINNKNYELVKYVLKKQNCLLPYEENKKYNPASDRAREIMLKIKQTQEDLEKIKRKEQEQTNDSLTLFDLVSILCSNGENGINILNVWDLTFFQFENQFKRLQMIEEYDVNIQALLHGADSNKIQLNHWMGKIR